MFTFTQFAWRRPTIHILWILGVAITLHSCDGGSCTRQSTGQEDSAVVTTYSPDDIQTILSQPVRFDAATVEEIHQLLRSTDTPSLTQTARAIVVSESSLNHLGQIFDQLAVNDDRADTWNVVTELENTPWVAQTFEIITILSQMQLDEAQSNRVVGLLDFTDHIYAINLSLQKLDDKLPIIVPSSL